MRGLPIAAWWLGWIALSVLNGLLSIVWLVSGVLMLVSCVLTDQAEHTDGLS